MILLPNGTAISGRAGSGVQRSDPDRAPMPLRSGPAGDPAFDGTHLIYRAANDTLHVCDQWGGADEEVDPAGSAPLFAGAGQWMAFLQGGGGVRTSWGLRLPDAGALGMAPDGTAFVTVDFQAGRGIAAYRPSGLTPAYVLHDATPQIDKFACLDGGRFVWVDGQNVLRGSGLGTVQQVEPAYTPALVEIDGRVWIVYTTQTRLLCHPVNDASKGFVVTTGDAFGSAGWSPAPGVAEIVFASNAGEIGTLTRVRVTLADAQPFAAPAVSVPRVDRNVWAGWFAFTRDAIDPPGNCGLYVGPGQDGIIRTSDGQPIAQYVAATHDSDVDELEQVIAAKRGPLPVLAYWTLAAQGVRVPNAEIVGIESYRKTAETLSGFDFRVRQTASRVGRAWLIAQCYTSNATNTADLLSLVPVYARILRDMRNVEGILVFSGNGRATGYQDHPEVQGAWRELFASVGVPDLGTVVPDPGTPAPSPIIEAPEPEPSDPFPGGLVNIITGRYDIISTGDTLKITPVNGASGSVPAIDYGTYHAGIERVTAARAARGQGPNLDIDAYRLIVEHHGDADALIAQNNAEPA